MAPMRTLLPPGFRFHPTDEELVAYYLDRKINGGIIELQVIPEIDLYKCEPWDLPEKSLIPSKDMEWYFYSPRDRKYPNGSRTNRATRSGYWKATGKDRFVQSQNRPVGMKKTLVYYRGRAPHGIRTDWVMHEYRLIESVLSGTTSSSLKDSYALCRVLKKNTIIPKDKEFESTASGSGQMSMSWDDSAPESSRDQKEEADADADADDVKNYELSSKLRSNASSSDLTPIASGPNGDDSSVALLVADEANSSIDQFNYGFGIQDISNFTQDELIPNYTGIFYENSFYPPLAMEDFPQMEECVNDITALEEIYSLCSSQDNLTYHNCVG